MKRKKKQDSNGTEIMNDQELISHHAKKTLLHRAIKKLQSKYKEFSSLPETEANETIIQIMNSPAMQKEVIRIEIICINDLLLNTNQ